MNEIINNCEQFDVGCANRVLGPTLGEEVVEVTLSALGEGVGLMSALSRAELRLASGKLRQLVIKCAARTENKEISKGLNFYRNEVNFYQHLAQESPIQSPPCLYAALEPDTQEFLLVLEDMGQQWAGDQTKSCTKEEMMLAFKRAAEFHAHFWQRTGDYPWLAQQNHPPTTVFRRDAIFKPGVEPTIKMFADYFNPSSEQLVRGIAEGYEDLFVRAMSAPPTIVHGDYRTDNMLIPYAQGKPEIVAVDWQNTSVGSGAHDIAYFSAQSCGNDLRGEVEQEALHYYYDTLRAGGVQGYSFEDLITDYRYNLMVTMITPIAVCGTLDQGNERGMTLGRIMLERSLAALETMDCAALL